ncbi:DUF2313 domain-containing protein [Limnobaculum zhutongyuii]|uniref:DUF2313 domain-containing protein n=2 Tax=Limnobaculum zhutongyuii TaxID=2498113 RepID=A0A411WR07_9GAMM|nr:DUF2313 domain-containing protein [Limnobaculum zhutongyuii]TQS88903.1 DUF2313 domain-containing protein [Limnobaculum zhutongyuii]
MNSATLLALLLPPVSYDPKGTRISAELRAEGALLDVTKEKSNEVLNAVTPFFANNLINDWERVLDVIPSTDATYQQRLERVLAKLSETGGLSIPYFKRIAASLGYLIEIQEFEPFRAGVNRAGDRIYVPEIIYVWNVIIYGNKTPVYRFRAGVSCAGERLTSFGDDVIETLFNELKPAFTYVYFSYKEEK